jgi:putative ABC transport system substrate-binding protein
MTSTQGNLRRLGFLWPGHRDAGFESWRRDFVEALEVCSWTEGSNLLIEWRFAEYDRTRYAPLAHDPAWAGVDVLVTGGTPLTHALSRAHPSVPLVTGVGDPVGSGFAKSVESPGFNITGLSWGLREKARKQIGLLIEIVPTVRTLLVLRSRQYGDIPELNACLEDVSTEHGLIAEIVTAESFGEIEAAFERRAGPLTSAAIIYGHGASQFDPSKVASAATGRRIATVGDERLDAEAGCLMTYSVRHASQARSLAAAVDRVLRGQSPARMPFALPDQSEFIVNRATADSLGLALSPDLLHSADAVIG